MTPLRTKLLSLAIASLLPSFAVAAIGLGHLDDHVGLGHFGNSAMDRYMSLMAPKGQHTSGDDADHDEDEPPVDQGPEYRKFMGDGSVAHGWPAKSEWIPFADLWKTNIDGLISRICDNSEHENAHLLRAINSVASSTGVDSRFILAVVMEESRGCVRVATTNQTVSNPGLMQSYQGKGSCAGTPDSPDGLKPCPYTQILQMVRDGTATNAAGVDLQDLLVRKTDGRPAAGADANDCAKYYRAARMYNSGPWSIKPNGELSMNGTNPCYASDIANRLLGYIGDGCGKDGAEGWQ